MAILPASSVITSATATEGDAKLWFTDVRNYINQMLGESGSTIDALKLLGAVLNSSVSKIGAYTVVSADKGKMIKCSGTWTLSLPSAASVGDGFVIAAANTSTGTITVDPYLTETINAQSTLILTQNQSTIMISDGANWIAINSGAAQPSGNQAFTSSGIFTVPTGVTSVNVTVVGGGGNGGSATGATAYGSAAGGGGGGGVAIKRVGNLVPGTQISVTVGGAAGTSSFSTYCSATGGATAAGVGAQGVGSGGAGGVGSGGDVNLSGGNGDAAFTSLFGGGGGGSLYGQGGMATPTYANGRAGQMYGAGGSGATKNVGTGTFSGGAGTSGLVIVQW